MINKLIYIFIFSIFFLSGCLPHTYERFSFMVINKKTYSNLYNIYYYDNSSKPIKFFVEIYDTGKTLEDARTIYHDPYNIRFGVIKNSKMKNVKKIKEVKVQSLDIIVNEEKTIDFVYKESKYWNNVDESKYIYQFQKLEFKYNEVKDYLIVSIEISVTFENLYGDLEVMEIKDVVNFKPFHNIEKTTLTDRIGNL